MTATYGSLFSGAGALEMGLAQVVPGTVSWHCQYEPPTKDTPSPRQAAANVLAHHWPDTPNLGDITQVDWTTVPRVDILCGGFPCTDVSVAGAQAGLIRSGDNRTRSGLWGQFATAISVLRPELVVIENVRGLLSARADSRMEPCPWCVGDERTPDLRALGAVLGDLADLGYDAWWTGLRASDVGTAHARFRVFIFAWPADAAGDTWRLVNGDSTPAGDPYRRDCDGRPAAGLTRQAGPAAGPLADAERELGEQRRIAASRQEAGGGSFSVPARCSRASVADADRNSTPDVETVDSERARADVGAVCDSAAAADTGGVWPREQHESRRERQGTADPHGYREVVADTDGARLGRVGRVDTTSALGTHGRGCEDGPRRGGEPHAWGVYAPVIDRWAGVVGRPAPDPTSATPKGDQRLNPRFVEWLMGWPAGHVTDVPGVARSDALKVLGNGVVPQQAAEAFRQWRSWFAAYAP